MKQESPEVIAAKVLADYDNPTDAKCLQLPSQHQIGDKVHLYWFPDFEENDRESFPALPAQVIAVHFFPGKVKYDLDLLFVGGQRSRIYNVDSILVQARMKETEPKKQMETEDAFKEASLPMIKYLCDNHHPHVTVIISSTNAQLFEGLKSTGDITEYLRD